MSTCEMTFDGGQCGQPVWRGVGLVDPVTDRYRCVQLSCRSCAGRLTGETTEQFRVLELDLAHRLRTSIAPTRD